MKKLLGVLALLCLSSRLVVGQTTTVAPKPMQSAVVHAPAGTRSQLLPDGLALLRAHDMAALLQSTTAGSLGHSPVLNGFFGPANYRSELAVVKVRRDASQPTLYHVQGKIRYKKRITPVSGTIALTQVVVQPLNSEQEIKGDLAPLRRWENEQPMYTATGQFELREPATRTGSGVYKGVLVLNFLVKENGSVEASSRTDRTLAQGGGIKYQGTWTSTSTGRTVPVLWVENIIGYRGPHAFADFLMGDRGMNINPKYAKLGWGTYWENDEWWAASPKPKLSL